MTDSLKFLRSLDKYDRLGDRGVFDLLTDGRTDQSGDFTEGCGLTPVQAMMAIGFLNAGRDTPIDRRFHMMITLESTEVGEGRTAWDEFLGSLPDGADLAQALDELYAGMVAASEAAKP